MDEEELSLAEKQLLLKIFEHRKGPRYLWDNEDHAEFEVFKDGYILGRDQEKGK